MGPGSATSAADLSTVPQLLGVVFDVDGTLVDSERDGHRVAFNRAFEEAGLSYRWDVETYGERSASTRVKYEVARDADSPPILTAQAEGRQAGGCRPRGVGGI